MTTKGVIVLLISSGWIYQCQSLCVKDFKCEVCGIPGMLQILSESYARVRHYKCLKDDKPVFEYRRNSIEYVSKTQGENKSSDLIGQNYIDLKLLNNCSLTENRRAGSLARLGHPLDVRKVTGSNPVRPTKTNKNAGINQESINWWWKLAFRNLWRWKICWDKRACRILRRKAP